HWAELDANGRFRVMANLGHAHGQCGDFRKSAECFLKAKAANPDDVRALALEALAHSYLDDEEKARELAKAVLDKDPTSAVAAAIVVQAAPDSMTLAEVETLVPPQLKEDPVVLHRLGWRALRCDAPAQAETLARKALAS